MMDQPAWRITSRWIAVACVFIQCACATPGYVVAVKANANAEWLLTRLEAQAKANGFRPIVEHQVRAEMPGMPYSSYVEERSADYQDVITIHIAMPESPHSEKMLEIVIQSRWRGARTWQRQGD